MKKFIGMILTLMLALSVGMAQAAQIDGLQSNSGPALPTGLDVYVNPGGLGDALIAGYYNARGSINFIRLVNTSLNRGVAVKVRFREGKFSNEVLDFYVCLSAGDQWTAWVFDEDENTPAKIVAWDDDTPTYPPFDGSKVSFKDGDHGAASCVTADMTKEGYFTVIGVSSWSDTPGNSKEISTSEQCAGVVGVDTRQFPFPLLDSDDPNDVPANHLFSVGNVITGSVVTYEYQSGSAAYGYNMLALADFSDQYFYPVGLGRDDHPRLSDCQDGIDGLNYVLTKSNLIAMYDIQDQLVGQSDIIVTFPTKTQTMNYYIDHNPFQGTIDTTVDQIGCGWRDGCEGVSIKLWDDEENSPHTTHGFSPSATTELKLCHEVNYIVMGENANSILNTEPEFNIGQDGYDIGWVNIDFTKHNVDSRYIALPDSGSPDAVAHGLPSIGFELGSFAAGGFGHMLPLRYSVTIDQSIHQ